MNIEDKLYPFLNIYHNSPPIFKKLIGQLYSLIPYSYRYGKFYNTYIKRIISLNKNELNITNLLYENVNYAINNIAFYNDFSTINDMNDFWRLPVVNKSIIQKNYDLFINKNLKNSIEVNTGGSTGQPFKFLIEKNKTRSKEKAHFDTYWKNYGFTNKSKLLVIRGKSLTKNRVYEIDYIKKSLVINSNEINLDNIGLIVREINKFRPNYVHAYPSSALLFLKFLKKSNLKIENQFEAFFLGSEGLNFSDAQNLEKYFSTKIINWYGHSECLIHGHRINNEGEFIFSNAYGYIELLDVNDNIITKPNIRGRIVATGFDNQIMPFIRYDTGDLAEISRYIKFQGRDQTVFKNIQGREKSYIYLKNGNEVSITSLFFGEHHFEFEYIREFQIIQDELGIIQILIVPLDWSNIDFVNSFRESLLKCLPKNTLEINIYTKNSIKKTHRGKHVLLIQNINKTRTGEHKSSTQYIK